MTAEFRMQNGEWITVHVMQSSTKEYDLFAFHKTTEMQRRIQGYEERLMLLTAGQYTASLKPLEGRIGTTVISAVSGGKLQHIAVGGGYICAYKPVCLEYGCMAQRYYTCINFILGYTKLV